MSRSLRKGPFLHFCFFRYKKRAVGPREVIKVYSRGSLIVPEFIGQTFDIHNGKVFLKLSVTENMVGHKFGEFSRSRKQTIHKSKSLLGLRKK
uniref:Small ribosomal subunit protein uS19c n=1 Tax=Scherffelia dubia TaxID=3190 RepID=A0A650ARA0_SCHDU|nr:ribosomal protein S19 [Scherffelia dubia]QGP70666.1 ribosomal protein S19 [Scherffelia dubia]